MNLHIKKKYPRFFVAGSIDNHWDNVIYIILEKPGSRSKWVERNGSNGSCYDELMCDQFVRNGWWRKIPIQEAALL